MKFEVSGQMFELELDAVVIAGYTGRDRTAVMHHIEELAAIGIPPPTTVPAYWQLPPWLATTDDRITVAAPTTSGEAELCLVVDGDDVYVSLASDHTDRQVETVDIGLSKSICQKPLARTGWPIADVDGHWDDLVLRSWIVEDGEEVAYQDGPCSSLVPPLALLDGIPFVRPRRFMMLTGTVPVIGRIRPADRFRAELFDPVHDRSISLTYAVTSLAGVG